MGRREIFKSQVGCLGKRWGALGRGEVALWESMGAVERGGCCGERWGAIGRGGPESFKKSKSISKHLQF